MRRLVESTFMPLVAVHRIKDGKIVEYWGITDVARVLQQVGALPGPPG